MNAFVIGFEAMEPVQEVMFRFADLCPARVVGHKRVHGIDEDGQPLALGIAVGK